MVNFYRFWILKTVPVVGPWKRGSDASGSGSGSFPAPFLNARNQSIIVFEIGTTNFFFSKCRWEMFNGQRGLSSLRVVAYLEFFYHSSFGD